MAASTRSRLSSGSPMPMNTMFVRRRPSADQPARREADLVDDLGGLEVAPEAELAGRAERAADGAAGLARDAQRVPLARPGPRRVVHQHRFDERAVGEAVERLLGQAAVGRRAPRCRRRCRSGRRRRAPSRRPAGQRRGSSAAPSRPPPSHTASRDLAGAVRRLAALDEPRGERRRGSGRRAPGRVVGGHGADASAAARRPTIPRRDRGTKRRPTPSAVPPAGWTSWSEQLAVGGRQSPPGSKTPGAAGRRRARRSPPGRRAGRRRSRRTIPATAGRRGPGARARRPVGPGRAGRPRGGAAGSASRRRSAAGAAASSPAQPRTERSAEQVRGDVARAIASRSGAVSVAVERHVSAGRRSARCRGPRPSA